MFQWLRKRFGPQEVVQTIGGREFTVRSEKRGYGGESVSGVTSVELFVWVSTDIGPCPPLRVAARETRDFFAITHDKNAGAVALGVPSFDDRFLVFSDDLAFVRRLTPVLVSAPGEVELSGGRITVHRIGRGHETAAATYLNSLIPLLPPELRR